ncbi:3-hydroxyisobutyrate dehydrogenase [Mesorhizobium sp. B3-2-1]|uniref:NADPH-dependent F420 reductase n=1 Tax=Mesorhizobium sp. B3-2-1 TaxID=2589891 RepID=UPI00112A1E2A|nr:NAD(P)-binding domain-containing protein [Mesorhizobium sp. B3-2-1]TPI29794.1 3-hydroxyisobutyrate dehydrogenase [Mesorhizobium sp. B3-2-1]
MRIGIIGAGNIGATLARKLSANGHTIKLAATRSPDKLRDLAEKVGAEPVTPAEAVKDVDVIIVSIPFGKNPELAGLFADVPANVVVIDTSNYYPVRDGNIAEVDDGEPESVWSSAQFGRPVVKAFNAILAGVLADAGKPRGAAGRIAIPVAGDDAAAKAVARRLVDETGFDAVDAGSLADSWRLQPGTPAYCTSLPAGALRDALAAADKARAPRNLRELMGRLGAYAAFPSTEEMTALNRELNSRR